MNKTLRSYLLLIALIASTAWVIYPAVDVASTSLPGSVLRKEYSFIQYDQNKIHIDGRKEKWNNLFRKFENLAFNGTGKISIVHIGGSHVQGGFLTDRLRANFNEMVYGAEGERGFVFPYNLAKSNSPKSIQCDWTGNWEGCRNSVSSDDCLWGMSGVSATCYDSTATVTLAASGYSGVPYSYGTIKIYNQRSSNVQIDADTNVTLLKVTEDPVTGFTEFVFTPYVNKFQFTFRKTDPEPSYFTFQGAYLGEEKSGLSYHAIGVNGASTRSYLRCGLFDNQLETLHPDLAIFGIGVNDANVAEGSFDVVQYEERYDSLIQKFLVVNPNTCILFVTNNDTYYHRSYPNRNAIKVQQSMYRLARKYDGAVYDLFEIMGGLGSIRNWQNAQLAAADKIHLSKRGYELQADMMSTAFREAFGNYLDKKQNP